MLFNFLSTIIKGAVLRKNAASNDKIYIYIKEFLMSHIYEIFLPLALILVLSKLLGLGSKKIGLPAVIGMLVAGIIIGLIKFIPGVTEGANGVGGFVYEALFGDKAMNAYSILAKIGVVLIMFSAGLGTELEQIKSTGVSAMIITALGVIVPMGLGFLVAFLFDYFTAISLVPGVEGVAGEVNIISDLFYGAVLTATSVSITVATLKELGKLNTNVGCAIISAAVIDDVLGIVILSVLTGLSGSSDTTGPVTWFNPNAGMVALKIVLFFVFAIGVGLLFRKLFIWLEKKYPHHRRVPIFSIALAFFYAYVSEKVFGVADITGAYLAGIMLCGLHETSYEGEKADSLGYLIFTPLFFANIGISYFDFSSFTGLWLPFGLCYVVAALLGKLIGCGAGGLISKFNFNDSTKIGLGMMVRAEVLLVCAQTGINSGLVDNSVSSYICLIIIISSLLSPTFIKLLYKKDSNKLSDTPVEQQV